MHESKQRIFFLAINKGKCLIYAGAKRSVCVYPGLGECRLFLGSHLKNTTDLFGFFASKDWSQGQHMGLI